MQTETMQKAKDTVMAFHQNVLASARWQLLETLVSSAYRSHLPDFDRLPRLASGRHALETRLRSAGALPNEIRRMVADCGMVYAHVKYPGTPTYAGVDA